MVTTGHSAGGHLAAMLLAARWPAWEADLPEKLYRGAVAVSGIYDLEPLRHAPFLNCDLNLTLERVAALSPLYMKPATDAPLVTAVGELESSGFKRQTAELGLAWKDVLLKELVLSGDHHLNTSPRIADRDGPLFKATLDLLRT